MFPNNYQTFAVTTGDDQTQLPLAGTWDVTHTILCAVSTDIDSGSDFLNYHAREA